MKTSISQPAPLPEAVGEVSLTPALRIHLTLLAEGPILMMRKESKTKSETFHSDLAKVSDTFVPFCRPPQKNLVMYVLAWLIFLL